VTGLLRDGGAVTGVRLADGAELRAELVLLCSGAATRALAELEVRPVKGQILRLAGAAGLLTGTVRALVRGRQVYLVPDGEDRLVVGATVEDRGFDDTVTAGGVYELLRDAVEVLPGVTELELLETLARWRPTTPDNAPVLGPAGLPGLVLATGHHRNGVLLTPVTGDAVAALLAGGDLPGVAAPFTIDRFRR
jgi:glycine oxidase